MELSVIVGSTALRGVAISFVFRVNFAESAPNLALWGGRCDWVGSIGGIRHFGGSDRIISLVRSGPAQQ